MTARESLGDLEQLVLLALLRLGDAGYGLAVRRELAARAEREVAIGAVYATLDRLERKGLVQSALGAGTPVRGGRPRRCFKVTASGLRALRRSQAAVLRMLEGLEDRLRPA